MPVSELPAPVFKRYLKLFSLIYVAYRFFLSFPPAPFRLNTPPRQISAPENGLSSYNPDLFDQVSVIILSGGVGKRFGAPRPKQYLDLIGIPVALHSLGVLAKHPYCKEVIVVCEPPFEVLFEEYFLSELYASVPEGSRPALIFSRPSPNFRHESMASGLTLATGRLVAVHDAARPLLRPADFTRVCDDAEKFGAAVLATPLKATVKEKFPDDMFIKATPDRANLWEAQTPQVFESAMLRRGVQEAAGRTQAPTDDASLVELFARVRITPGDYENFKITTSEDLLLAETVMRKRLH